MASAAPQEAVVYSFGRFALDAGQRVLARDGQPLHLTPRELDILAALVVRHGELVDKGWLLQEVWRGVCVEECNLSQHVAALRRVLEDDARQPIYIETVPRRGYRFVARVAIGAEALRVGGTAQTAPVAGGPALRQEPPLAATVVPDVPPAVAPPPPDVPPAAALPPPEVPPAVVPPPPEVPPAVAPPPPDVPPAVAPRAPPAPPRRSRFALAALALAMVAGTASLGSWTQLSGTTAQPRLLRIGAMAILPTTNLTGDGHQDAVARQVTSDLSADLARIAGLRIVRTEPAAGAGHPASGAEAILETALLGGQDGRRVAVELIDARTERLLWAEVHAFDLVTWGEVRRNLVRALVGQLGDARQGGADDVAAGAVREQALARQYLSQGTGQVVEEALEHFQAAAALDPMLATAHVGVAEAYLLGLERRVLEPKAALAGAEAAARRALEIDPDLAEARGALGEVAAARWDFEAAEAYYRSALALDPSLAGVHADYAMMLAVMGRRDEAVAEARIARDLNPGCPVVATVLAAVYSSAGLHEQAQERALAALRLKPNFAPAYAVLGWAHQARGHHTEAVAAFGEAARLSGRAPHHLSALARAHASAGAREEALGLLGELERRASALELAEVRAALGEPDRAAQLLERAVAEATPWLQQVESGIGLAVLPGRPPPAHHVARLRLASIGAVRPLAQNGP
jgi:DNA-binding winged helix-turn-helix (wHTH) protein/tetratricopeptide (TPR) repeat protein